MNNVYVVDSLICAPDDIHPIADGEFPGDEAKTTPDRKNITELDGLQEEWYKEAKSQTMETLSTFITGLVSNYEHDYGTICHAITASFLEIGRAHV